MNVDYNAGGLGVPITSFAVTYQDITVGASDVEVPHSPAPTLNDVDIGSLAPGHQYRFWVQAVNKHGTGEASDPLEVVAATFPPMPDVMTIAYEGASFYVKFSWEDPTPDEYQTGDL